MKSQLEIINPVKDIALENKINKLIIVQVKKKINSLKTIVGDFPILRDFVLSHKQDCHQQEYHQQWSSNFSLDTEGELILKDQQIFEDHLES